MPVPISILTINIGILLGNQSLLNTADTIGIFIKYLALFITGGVVSCLHEDETNLFKFVETGVATPALITSMISAQGITIASDKGISSSFLEQSIVRLKKFKTYKHFEWIQNGRSRPHPDTDFPRIINNIL